MQCSSLHQIICKKLHHFSSHTAVIHWLALCFLLQWREKTARKFISRLLPFKEVEETSLTSAKSFSWLSENECHATKKKGNSDKIDWMEVKATSPLKKQRDGTRHLHWSTFKWDGFYCEKLTYSHAWMNCKTPFTQLRRNKAGYTATPVACGWAGLYLRSLDHLGRSSEVKEYKTKTKK